MFLFYYCTFFYYSESLVTLIHGPITVPIDGFYSQERKNGVIMTKKVESLSELKFDP